MAFVNVTGPVVAETVYANNKLVAKDVELTLPAVTPTTADVQAMGTMSIPIPQLLENMELSITKIGTDLGLSSDAILRRFPHRNPLGAECDRRKRQGVPHWLQGVPALHVHCAARSGAYPWRGQRERADLHRDQIPAHAERPGGVADRPAGRHLPRLWQRLHGQYQLYALSTEALPMETPAGLLIYRRKGETNDRNV